MGFEFGDPSIPRYVSGTAFHIELTIGAVVALAATVAIDKVANFMFRRGYAKPFYVLGKRVHHVWIYGLVPACYLALSYLMLVGDVQLIRSLIWFRLSVLVALIGLCMSVDFVGDTWRKRSGGLIRHEWVYALIPAYIFTFLFVVFI